MRLWISVFAAVCFGVSNAFVLWTIKAVLHRLEPPKTQIVVESNIEPLSQNAGFASEWIDGAMAKKETLQKYSEALSKEWLPEAILWIMLQNISAKFLSLPSLHRSIRWQSPHFVTMVRCWIRQQFEFLGVLVDGVLL